MPIKKIKRPSRTQLIKKADKLFSEYIRKAGECAKCGSKNNLQCAHIISRVNKNLRWNPDNAVCLCLRCHLYWGHKSPLEFAEWFRRTYPINYAFLMKEKDNINPELGNTIEFTIKDLEEKLNEK